MKKLICHCGEVELEIKESEGALNKFLRCNCTLCKKKGYIMTFAPITDVKITKGEDKLKLYQYHRCIPHLIQMYRVYFSFYDAYKFHILSKNNALLLWCDIGKV